MNTAREMTREELVAELRRTRAALAESISSWWHWMTIPFSERSIIIASQDQKRIARFQKDFDMSLHIAGVEREVQPWEKERLENSLERDRLASINRELVEALEQALHAHKGDWQNGSGWEKSARAP